MRALEIVRGLRGFSKELSRTGSARALWLQVRTGARHVARRLRGGEEGDPIALFLRNYGADGVRLPDPDLAAVQRTAQACLACGLCDLECARVTGPLGPEARPHHAPLEAVVCASRLAIDVVRLGPSLQAEPPREAAGPDGSPCAGCRACDEMCPVSIPIARVQTVLAALEAGAAKALPAPSTVGAAIVASAPGMR